MASCRKPTYKVEIKPITERKRRKSDLVIMWQSIWDFSVFLLTKLWYILLDIINVLDLADERQEIQTWLKKHLPIVPNDFSDSWRDGVLLGILLNKLQPGCFPDAATMDIDYGLRNVYRAFNILEARFNIVPKVSPEEIVTCTPGSNLKLLELLLQLKNETENQLNGIKTAEEMDERKEDPTHAASASLSCIAKGTGLLVGFAGREANFVVFYASMPDLDLVIEIKGPSNTICCERITKRSPKKKQVIKPWKPSLHSLVARSLSDKENLATAVNEGEEIHTKDKRSSIPLEYEIHTNQITFTYTPLVKGHHRVSILSHGQHVSDSPYSVEIEPAVGTYGNNVAGCCKSILKAPNTLQSSNDTEAKKDSVRFEEPKNETKGRLGKVIKRRVLRYIVRIDSKDVVVDGHSIDSLATSLLKMDYELQKRPLSRRNSWGFVGDAERKVSMIRQFCVNLDELEEQSLKMQRSNSLSFSNKLKKSFPRRGSYELDDSIQRYSKLETVTEGKDLDSKGSFMRHDDEEKMFAYLDEEYDCKKEFFKSEEENLKRGNERNRQQLKELASGTIVEPILQVKRINDSNQAPDQHTYSISNRDSLEYQDLNPSQNVKKPPDHLILASDVSERLDTFLNDDVFLPSNPSMNFSGHEQTPFSFTIDQQNLVDSVANDLVNNNYLAPNQKKFGNPEAVELDCKAMKTESLVINSNSTVWENNEAYETSFIEEKPCTKTIVNSLQSSPCLYGEQVSATILKSKMSNDADSGEDFKENTTFEQCRTEEEKKEKNYFKYFSKEVPKTINSVGNKKVTDNQTLNKEKHEHNPDRHKAYPRQRDKNNASCSAIKKQKIDFDDVQIEGSASNLKCKAVLQKFDHVPLSNDTKDCNHFKLEKQTLKYMNVDCGKSQDILTDMPEDFYPASEQEHLLSQHNGTLPIDSEKKNYENKVYDATLSQLSGLSIKNNQLRNQSKSTLLHILSTQMKESSEQSWNLRNDINACHYLKDININKINYLPDTPAIKQNAEMSLYTPNVVSENLKCNHGSSENIPTENRISASLGQFNFRHLNTPIQNNTDSPVKTRIKQWQNAVYERTSTAKKKFTLEAVPEKGNITDKLKFWENLQRNDDKIKISSEQLNLKSCKDSNAIGKSKLKNKENGKVAVNSLLPTKPSITGGNFKTNLEIEPSIPVPKKEENSSSVNQESNVLWEKHTDNKLSIPPSSTRIRKRSFSDPGDLETSRKEKNASDLSGQIDEISHEPSRENLSSSTDANYLELSADDEISSADLLYSTEDEYIDDEISESASTYWGDLSFVKSLKLADSASYREFCSLLDSEYFRNRSECFTTCPYECKVFGIANYFGHVAVKNRFRVLTNGAGCGNLSATVQGLGQHDVSFVSVEYMQRDVYEVTYQVLSPGLYLISVRWMENPISGSPFLCKVTF